MTPAEELTAAAIKLRSLTADATEDPWHADDPNTRWGDDREHRLIGGGKILAVFSSDYNGPLNCDYTGAMHPGVGKALADWLDFEADLITRVPGAELRGRTERALAVARAILGGEQQ